ncbi:MAG: Holliday junction branch migration protein RuvA [Firmicutes bacterium]|nr:Holliday junction branch migration protein RuvA [Bacillota bacterium]
MIAFVRGTLVAREAGSALVETAGGMGLLILVPDTTQRQLPEPGKSVRLYTHLVIREDSWQLAGFMSVAERDIFLALLNVTGVGPKLALAILGQVGIDGLVAAISEGRWQRLREVSGVGPKLAQRLIVELRGVLAEPLSSEEAVMGEERAGIPGAADVPADDVLDGLRALGYTDSEARFGLAGSEGQTSAERLRWALSRLDPGGGIRHA